MSEVNRYGACIVSGAKNWQVFQQIDGACDIPLAGTWARHRLDFEPPLVFQPIDQGEVCVRARIVSENEGQAVIPWVDCQVFDHGEWKVTLASVPAGGPYRVEATMTYGGWDGLSITRGDMIHHIGVGDIFIIAGQSNAAGRAKEPVYDPPAPDVRLLRASGEWDMATHPMADETSARFTGHYANHNPGHNPYLAFARRLTEALHYPIGLVMTAYGGAPLRWWNPDENGALFREMLEITQIHCPRVRGVLWYQGEGDAMEQTGDTYLSRFSRFVTAVRDALAAPELPFFTVQLGRITGKLSEMVEKHWALVREAQRKAGETIPFVYTVPAVDLLLYDNVHISAQGNIVLGQRLANCALATLYGAPLPWKSPQVKRALAMPDGRVRVFFDCINYTLNLYAQPAPKLPFAMEDKEGLLCPIAYEQVGADQLLLNFERRATAGNLLHGAYQGDPPGQMPCDQDGLPMLAFYGWIIE